ncbi:Chromosome partition protein Smc [Mycoplasma anatis]|uniref:hypothetical protein n=1 Tax=Mycoplasmopsis anatis TaxID=171279 RepID=UPI001C4DF866|nr:hypothetical protein [Mycoplasmopsis anatis]MBW0595839.1 Chromosome partition protein Smc [Mycoplasmopsis anatis]MBW0597242.1 Chromosome partition protein Smc [Mycoplasmopsis anatis]MBW0600138.1 Chromosome partition protein Smc [Mycoplasmopsis anatis]
MTKNSNKKRWSIVALSSAAVLAATLIPLSVKYCSAVKTIEKRDEEIKLLKLKISNLTSEKEKLISERDELSKKLTSLQTKYDELKLNYDKTLTNFKSITGSILDRSNNYKAMLERYYNNANPENEAENTNNNEILSFEAELEKIRNGIQEKITQYVKLLTEKIDLYKSKNAELMNNNDEINLLIEGLEEIKNFGVNIPLETSEDIVKATQWISMSDKEVLSILEKINAKYENYISELKEIITQKDKIIENSFNTARELVNQAIKTTENQIDYLASIKEIVYKFVNRDYSSYASDEFANSMRNEALSLINEINDYSSTAQKVLDQAKADYQKALKSKNIEDFSNINIESFPIKNKTFTKLIEALNQRDYEALFNKNAENWKKYNDELAKYNLAMSEKAKVEAKLNEANDTIETLKLDISNKESLITNLETKLKDNLVNTITHTSDLLNDLITTLETDNLKEINEIATPLKEQYEILKQVLLEVNEADFAEKNSEKVYLAIDTIQNILETYKSARVLPLEAIVINLAEKIRELNEERERLSAELNSANNTIKTKNSEIESLNNRILELSENITENEEEIENLNKQRSALISEKEQLTLEKTTLISKLSAKEKELSSKNTEYEQAKSNYETQLREKDLRISDLERQLREQGGSNSALESELAALKRENSTLSSQVLDLTVELSTVKSERDSLSTQLRSAKATIIEKDAKIKQLEKENQKLRNDILNPVQPTPPAPLPNPVVSNKSVVIGYDLLSEEYPKYTLTSAAAAVINSWKWTETHLLDTTKISEWFEHNGNKPMLGSHYSNDLGKVKNQFILRKGIKEKVRIPENAKSAKMKLLFNGEETQITLTKGVNSWNGTINFYPRAKANFDLNWVSITRTPNGSYYNGIPRDFTETRTPKSEKWEWPISSQSLSLSVPFTSSPGNLEAINRWDMIAKGFSKPTGEDIKITGDLDIFKGINSITILEISWEE